MPLTPQERKVVVDDLIANCDCWKGHGDRDILNGFTDDKLTGLKVQLDKDNQMRVVANAAVTGFSHDGRSYRINPETGNVEVAKGNPGPLTNKKKKAPPPPVDEEDEEEEDEEEEEEETYNTDPVPRKTKVNPIPEPSFKKPRTAEEWFRMAPQEVQNTFQYARGIEQQQKDNLISRLLSNVAEGERQAYRDWLQQQPIPSLNNMISLLPPTAAENLGQIRPSGQPRTRRSTAEVDPDILVQPTLNWESIARGETNPSQVVRTPKVTHNEDQDNDYADEEALSHLTPRQRSELAQAATIINGEKSKLIDKLTENIHDEGKEKRLRARLERKSIDELRDLEALSEGNGKTTTNYFGASVPLSNVRTSDAHEDLLVPPTTDWSQLGKKTKAG